MKPGILILSFAILMGVGAAGQAQESTARCVSVEPIFEKFVSELTVQVSPNDCVWTKTGADGYEGGMSGWKDGHKNDSAVCDAVGNEQKSPGRWVAMGYLDNSSDEIRCCKLLICRGLECH